MSASSSLIDQAIAILANTRDGDDLAPHHLALVQHAANSRLNDAGRIALADLYAQTLNGYQRPWLHDIEHLTLDHTGNVYWKAEAVEHYDLRFAYSDKGRAAAEELARRCRAVEARGEKPDHGTVVWHWSEPPAHRAPSEPDR